MAKPVPVGDVPVGSTVTVKGDSYKYVVRDRLPGKRPEIRLEHQVRERLTVWRFISVDTPVTVEELVETKGGTNGAR